MLGNFAEWSRYRTNKEAFMAKSKKSSTVAQDNGTQMAELVEKNKQIGGWLVATLYLLRREFVKNLSQKQFSSTAGAQVIEALKHIESKSPSTPCQKCGATGVYFSTYSNSYSVCYDCVMGRLLGKPGMQHAIDRKVSESYRAEGRNNRFSRDAERAPAWQISEEEIAKHKAAKQKPAEQGMSADITF